MRTFPQPLYSKAANAIVAEWLGLSQAVILSPGARHGRSSNACWSRVQAMGPLVMDAHLAALAIEHGATLATGDRDLARFQGLQAINPL